MRNFKGQTMKTKLLDILAMLAAALFMGYMVAEFLTGIDPFYK
jgi:hypothetical protein